MTLHLRGYQDALVDEILATDERLLIAAPTGLSLIHI